MAAGTGGPKSQSQQSPPPIHPKAIAFIRAKPCMVAVAGMAVMYWSHRALRGQYHRQCNSDLIRVVLFNQSPYCANLSGVLSIVEVATHQVFAFFAMSVWNALGSAGVAMAGCAAAAAASAAAAAAAMGGARAHHRNPASQQSQQSNHSNHSNHPPNHPPNHPMSVFRGFFVGGGGDATSNKNVAHFAGLASEVAAENVQNKAYRP